MRVVLAQLVDILPDVKYFYAAWAAPAVGFLIMWLLQRATPSRSCWVLIGSYYLVIAPYYWGASLPGAMGAVLSACFALLAGPVLAVGFVLVGLSTGRVRRIVFPFCPRGGYNLTSNRSGTCPECGTAIYPAWRSRLMRADRDRQAAGEKKTGNHI